MTTTPISACNAPICQILFIPRPIHRLIAYSAFIHRVSPGLRSRPSLSAPYLVCAVQCFHRVAGTTVPAFVERPTPRAARCTGRVSPGLRSRPSLSVQVGQRRPDRHLPVSPGLRSRPSLSAQATWDRDSAMRVSPGLRSRPSLSDRLHGRKARQRRSGCRRDYGPGLR